MEYKIGQKVKTVSVLGTYEGVVESINPTHSRLGVEYVRLTPHDAIGIAVEGQDDTLWMTVNYVEPIE